MYVLVNTQLSKSRTEIGCFYVYVCSYSYYCYSYSTYIYIQYDIQSVIVSHGTCCRGGCPCGLSKAARASGPICELSTRVPSPNCAQGNSGLRERPENRLSIVCRFSVNWSDCSAKREQEHDLFQHSCTKLLPAQSKPACTSTAVRMIKPGGWHGCSEGAFLHSVCQLTAYTSYSGSPTTHSRATTTSTGIATVNLTARKTRSMPTTAKSKDAFRYSKA